VLNKNEIANLALGRLGVSISVSDFDLENSTQAKVIKRQFQSSLDTLLESHPWNFATKYEALSLISENVNPNVRYRYAYSYPAQCLVIRSLGMDGVFSHENEYTDTNIQWEEIYTGGTPTLLTWVEDAHACFTVAINQDQQMPTHFGRALAAQLAMDIAPSLITNNFGKVRDTLYAAARSDISLGVANDLGRQPKHRDAPSPFIRARLG
jgi:hypothetical protein